VKRVVELHAVKISIFPMNARIDKSNFPQRQGEECALADVSLQAALCCQ
jgi:hypothetical protein